MQHQNLLDEEQTLKSVKSPKFAVSSVSIDNRTSEVSPMEEQKAPQSKLIENLCHAIRDPLPRESLGYLADQHKSRLEFIPINSPVSASQQEAVVTLDEILKEDAMKLHKFPPEKRANVATILASSLLQLQRTHWLKDNWTRKYIFFVMRDDKPVFDEPYFSQDFMSSKSHPETASTPPQP